MELFPRTVVANNTLFARTVPVNNTLFAGTVPVNNMVFARTANKKLDFSFFLYCTARQHPAQNASIQRHGQPAPTDIWEDSGQ